MSCESRGFVRLAVAHVRNELGGAAKTLVFDVPPSQAERFRWRPGQHVTPRVHLDGEELRRSYSISSSPYGDEGLRITVKRVAGGRVSNFINDRIEAGHELEVMPPFGGFCLDPGLRLRRTHYFFGAGSGITPLYSMLHSVLEAEPYSVAHLIFGNTNADTILFRDALDALRAAHPRRLTVSHVLSSPSMGSSVSPWRTGRLDARSIEAVFAEHPPYAQDTQYYVCGPGDMNAAVRGALMGLDVPQSRIHEESYGGAIEEDRSIEGIAATARVLLAGREHTVPIAAGQTVLQAVRSASLTPPFSCQSGVCGACRGHLREGHVHLRARMALEDSELERGAILTCQAVPTTPSLSVVYD